MNGTGALGPVTNTITFTYAAAAAECTTPESSYAAGATVTVTCSGFEPSLSVAAVLHSAPVALGSFSTGAGSFTFSFKIPATFDAGAHSVTLNLGTSTLVITAAFTVTAALAATGVETVLPLTLAGIMLALGAALLVYRRRAVKRA
jgi:LPXTG-motif cell wall-anchored protein